MTTEQALKIIEQNLMFYVNPVPKRLMKTIKDVIISTRITIIKEYISTDCKLEKPDFLTEWNDICTLYGVDTETAKSGRNHVYVSARCHFIRSICTQYHDSMITLTEIGKFLNKSHDMVIFYRDFCKANCILPPLGISKWKRFKPLKSKG